MGRSSAPASDFPARGHREGVLGARVGGLLLVSGSVAAGVLILVLTGSAALAPLPLTLALGAVLLDRRRRRRAGYEGLGLLPQGRGWTGLHEGHPVAVRPVAGEPDVVRVEVHLPRRGATAPLLDAPRHAPPFQEWARRRRGLQDVHLGARRVAVSLRGGLPEPDELARDLDALVALARAASHLTQERPKRSRMRIVRFVANADPLPSPRLGAMREGKVIDLQASHFAMTGAPNPALRAPEDLRARGDADALVQRVAEWAGSQDVPGTMVSEDAVRVLDAFDV